MKAAGFGVAVALLALATLSAAPQRPTFSSGILAVRVDAQVMDGRRPVPGLRAEDFVVLDNGVPQTVSLVDTAAAPINVVLAFDLSGSTSGRRLADLTTASEALIAGLKSGDRIGLTTFTHSVAPRIALTPDFPAVTRALSGAAAAGDTSLFDALHIALLLTQAEAGRSLVVVCSDGRDTASWLRPDEVLESARRSNAVVTFVAAGRARQWEFPRNLAQATGGDTIDVESTDDLRREFERVLRDFRSRYVVSYTPSGVTSGGYHRPQVSVRNKGFTVRARPGYFGGGEVPR